MSELQWDEAMQERSVDVKIMFNKETGEFVFYTHRKHQFKTEGAIGMLKTECGAKINIEVGCW